MDKLVKIGVDSNGKPLRVPARELASQLHGRGWIYPHQLKAKYNIPDELWSEVQKDIAEEWRSVYREHRDNDEHLSYLKTDTDLSRYALALPHNASMQVVSAVNAHIANGQIDELADYIVMLIMEPTYRARLVLKRYNEISLFKEFAHLIEASYFAFLRDNFAAAFMTILPVIEGIISRWADRPHKMSFPEMWEFVRKTPERNPLLSLPLFADIWAETCASIMEHHFYKKTTKGSAFADFNRHLALHLIQSKDFCTHRNIMRAFLLLDLLGDLYLAERNQYDGIDTRPDEMVAPFVSPYWSIVKSRDNNTERAMVRYPQYKTLLAAYEKMGNPAVYWKEPRMPSFGEILKKIGLVPGPPK